MSEKSAPYLHLVRQTPSGGSDGAARTDTGDIGNDRDDETDQGSDHLPAPSDAPSDAPKAASAADTPPLNQPLQQAIMYAAVSWVALCVERSVYAVDIQPIARNVYEVSVHYADRETGSEAAGQSSEGIILRVRLAVERGLALETTVEPVHP